VGVPTQLGGNADREILGAGGVKATNTSEAFDAASLRRGWCPGALRPMESGDGLLVRLRISGGALSWAIAAEIANLAEKFGNSHIDLTSRANLQIRGVREETLAPLQTELERIGLIDAGPGAEAVRNVLASPLAGFDPSALIDIRPGVEALERRLQSDRALHSLPAKFSFLIDDGSRFSIADERADIAFLAERRNDEILFSIRLAGQRASWCRLNSLAESAARIAIAFLALREDGDGSAQPMAALVRRTGVDPILRLAWHQPETSVNRDEPRRPSSVLGQHDLGSVRALGIGVPFGRLSAASLRRVAKAAELAQGELRLTPWRTIIIIAKTIDPALRRSLGQTSFIFDESNPMRAVAACPGAPSCARGSTATQKDGERLAQIARSMANAGIGLHVSGCAKGCAHGKSAPVTLVGRDGRYDLVLDGVASDRPVVTAVAADQLSDLLNSILEAPPSQRPIVARQFAKGRA
jgi:precorrin-3B synthase